MFRLLRGIYEQNRDLQKTGRFFYDWAEANYIAASAMAFRRELDTRSGTENLFHVLCEMRDRPSVICRARFRSTWEVERASHKEAGDSEHFTADHAFDTLPIVRKTDNPDLDHLAPASIAEDLRTLETQDSVLLHVQKTIAHRMPKTPEALVPTFGDLHEAIEVLREVIHRYYRILTQKAINTLEPTADFDVYTPFRLAWIPDPDQFDYSRCE